MGSCHPSPLAHKFATRLAVPLRSVPHVHLRVLHVAPARPVALLELDDRGGAARAAGQDRQREPAALHAAQSGRRRRRCPRFPRPLGHADRRRRRRGGGLLRRCDKHVQLVPGWRAAAGPGRTSAQVTAGRHRGSGAYAGLNLLRAQGGWVSRADGFRPLPRRLCGDFCRRVAPRARARQRANARTMSSDGHRAKPSASTSAKSRSEGPGRCVAMSSSGSQWPVPGAASSPSIAGPRARPGTGRAVSRVGAGREGALAGPGCQQGAKRGKDKMHMA